MHGNDERLTSERASKRKRAKGGRERVRVNADFPEFRSAEGRDHAIWPYGGATATTGETTAT